LFFFGIIHDSLYRNSAGNGYSYNGKRRAKSKKRDFEI